MSVYSKYKIMTIKNKLDMSISTKDYIVREGFLPSSKVKLNKEEKEEIKTIRDELSENSAHTLGAVFLKLK